MEEDDEEEEDLSGGGVLVPSHPYFAEVGLDTISDMEPMRSFVPSHLRDVEVGFVI